MGALSYTLAGTDALQLIAELNPAETGNDELLLRRLAPFLLAGLQAPLPDLSRAADSTVARARGRTPSDPRTRGAEQAGAFGGRSLQDAARRAASTSRQGDSNP